MSGSSPSSDISQPASQDGMRRLMSKKGKWKMFVRATSPESTSRSSSKTGRETPENGETGNLCLTLNFKGQRCRREFLCFLFLFFCSLFSKKGGQHFTLLEKCWEGSFLSFLHCLLSTSWWKSKILKGWHPFRCVFTTDWGLLLPSKTEKQD